MNSSCVLIAFTPSPMVTTHKPRKTNVKSEVCAKKKRIFYDSHYIEHGKTTYWHSSLIHKSSVTGGVLYFCGLG